MATLTEKNTACFHCGEACADEHIHFENKIFCCEGCKTVYGILNKTGLCDYYSLNNHPGLNQRASVRKDKFAFLDNEEIIQKMISFRDENQFHLTFYLPAIHCSSCLYLVENLHKIKPGIISSKINFIRKEAEIIFNHKTISLREVAETLTSIGYEPYISLNNLGEQKPKIQKKLIYQLGVAGFCFGNIMLMSFPEYLGLEAAEKNLQFLFRSLNFFLALPVFFFSAQPFYRSAWKSLRHRFLNIDAPIALAIIVTFARSAYEVISGTGAGYFDSMTGIVFFMLAGRVLQDRTYQQLSFERDYTSYFPIAITAIREEKEITLPLPSIKPGDTLLIHNEELIPADGILTRGKAWIDYSFVTGESIPVLKETGELVYAGGKQTGANIEILVVKEVSQSYLTKLWNKDSGQPSTQKNQISFVHLLSRYFTYIVFAIALCTATWWWFHDPSKIWNSVTAIMIIACPCALLLSSSFTNGNILRILGKNHFYLRNAQTIENIAGIDHVVFDKTGTLTLSSAQDILSVGAELTAEQLNAVATLSAQSTHPLSRMLALKYKQNKAPELSAFTEHKGQGVEGVIEGNHYRLGSALYTGALKNGTQVTSVFLSCNQRVVGEFRFAGQYRDHLGEMLRKLKAKYRLSVVSGDHAGEKNNLRRLFGETAALYFQQRPEDKLHYVEQLQQHDEKVMMIGDGLNDAGALNQSNIGIAVAEDTNNFTPASDAILEAKQLPRLYRFIRYCQANRQIILASFILSVVYNLIGLFFAIQGNLSPLVAAILMPSSSLSILLITFGCSTLAAKLLGLRTSE